MTSFRKNTPTAMCGLDQGDKRVNMGVPVRRLLQDSCGLDVGAVRFRMCFGQR